jgi:hypothetical protein
MAGVLKTADGIFMRTQVPLCDCGFVKLRVSLIRLVRDDRKVEATFSCFQPATKSFRRIKPVIQSCRSFFSAGVFNDGLEILFKFSFVTFLMTLSAMITTKLDCASVMVYFVTSVRINGESCRICCILYHFNNPVNSV